MGDFHRALYDMNIAISLEENKRDLAELHNFCVILLFELGTMQDAIYHAEQATKNDPSNGMNLFNKGLILANLGKID